MCRRASAVGSVGVMGIALLLPAWAHGAGFGAIGDSFVDEYEFYPPDRTTAREFVEILHDVRGLDFGPFTTASRGEPRNQGYAYDWGRDGATTGDVLSEGQAAGLAGQVQQGKVSTAIVFVGADDFRNLLTSPDPVAALNGLVPQMVTHVSTAVGTLLAANPKADVVLCNLPDVTKLPEVQALLQANPSAAPVVQAVGQAVVAYNGALAQQFAGNNQVAIDDVFTLGNDISGKPLTVGGVTIDQTVPADDFRHLFLADGVHLGTIGQGFLANSIIGTIDQKFGGSIAPITDRELVTYAEKVQSEAIPLPPAWAMGMTGLALSAYAARRRRTITE